jgi:hypothetical protein
MEATEPASNEPEPLPVFVLATTAEPTRHALAVARAISSDRHAALGIITAPKETLTVSSARAHVHALPVDDWDPRPLASPEFVRGLAANEAPSAQVIVVRSMASRDIPPLLPAHSTVVLAGPIRHFFESREQRLGRRLAEAGYDVVFIPCRDRESTTRA